MVELEVQVAVLIGAGDLLAARRRWLHVLLSLLGLQQDRDERLVVRYDRRRHGGHLDAALLLLLLGVEAQGARSFQFQRSRRRLLRLLRRRRAVTLVAEKSTRSSSNTAARVTWTSSMQPRLAALHSRIRSFHSVPHSLLEEDSFAKRRCAYLLHDAESIFR